MVCFFNLRKNKNLINIIIDFLDSHSKLECFKLNKIFYDNITKNEDFTLNLYFKYYTICVPYSSTLFFEIYYCNKIYGDTIQYTPHDKTINCLKLHPNGQIISGSDDASIVFSHTIYNNNTDYTILEEHNSWVYCLLILSNGLVASGCYDEVIKIWQVSEENSLYTLRGHIGPVSCLAELSNYKLLASGSGDRTVRLWDMLNNFECVKTFNCFCASIWAMYPVINTNELIIASGDTIHLLTEEKKVTIIEGYCSRIFCLIKIKTDQILMGHNDGYIRVLDNMYKFITEIYAHKNPVCFLLELKNSFVASIGNNEIKIWNPLKDFNCVYYIQNPKFTNSCLLEIKINNKNNKNINN